MRLIRYQNQYPFARRNPFLGSWSGLEDEIDRLVQSAFSGSFPQITVGGGFNHPQVDLYEDKDNLFFRAELPGMKKEDIHVELTDGVLTLSGERKTFEKDGEAKTTSKFSRSLSVPTRVKADKITAHYENGVLTATLPKAEEVKPKRIAIEVK
jgi:HSP20 family protein